MDREQQKIRESLERRLAQLRTRTGKIDSDLRRPGNPDWSEQVTQRENEEVLEHLGRTEFEEMEEIRSALERLDAGRYGFCDLCGSGIEPRRLEVLPFARTCIGCAEGRT